MTTCPNGHVSADSEWCDTCGAPLAPPAGAGSASSAGGMGSGTASAAPAGEGTHGPVAGSTSGPDATTSCPACGDVNPASNLFCESCGLDFVTGQAPPPEPQAPSPAPAPIDGGVMAVPTPIEAPEPIDPGADLGWSVTIAIDADWFAAKGEGIGTPPSRAERTQELRHSPLTIGRTRSTGKSPGIVVDDDHGISRRHAELIHDAEHNTWSVTDLGSTNGTFVVGAEVQLSASLVAIAANTPTTIGPTDRVFVGAWTRLVLRQTSGGSSPVEPGAVRVGDPDQI